MGVAHSPAPVLTSAGREREREACRSGNDGAFTGAPSQPLEDMADKAEQAAARGEMSTIYKITKKLSGKYTSQSAPVKDKDGNILRTEQEQTARWAQHFREVLNCPSPDDPANPPPAEHVLNFDTSPPTNKEVKLAIKAMKGGKAAGADAIHAEILKANLNTFSTGLLRSELFLLLEFYVKDQHKVKYKFQI